jgi:hypothetical protein
VIAATSVNTLDVLAFVGVIAGALSLLAALVTRSRWRAKRDSRLAKPGDGAVLPEQRREDGPSVT